MDCEALYRLIANLIRRGTVAAVDAAAVPPRVRVQSGGLLTDWLAWLETRAGNTRTWDAPTVGEQVVLLAPGGDPAQAVVLRGLPSGQIDTPSHNPDETVRVYPDGARVSYHHVSGHLQVSGVSTVRIEASEQITLAAPLVLIDGKATVTDLLSYQAGLSGQDGKGYSTAITGDFTHVNGNLSSNGVVLHTHTHGGVRAGGDDTAGPN